MKPPIVVLLLASFLFVVSNFHGGLAITTGTEDGSELWGYVEVRPSKQKKEFDDFTNILVAIYLKL